MIYDRGDLPEAITKMSFDSYTVPVDEQGNLPFKLFDRKLNFKRLQEKNISFLICYAEKDDLVDDLEDKVELDHDRKSERKRDGDGLKLRDEDD